MTDYSELKRLVAQGSLPPIVATLIAENEALRKDAERYRWLRDKSEAVHNFYISVPLWFKNVKVEAASVDAYIDSAMSKDAGHD